MLQTEKRYTSKLIPNNNQQRYENGLGLKQPYTFQKPEQQQEKNQGEEREQQSAKQKLQASKQRGSESKPLHDAVNLQKKHQHMSQATHTKKSSKEAIRATQSEGFPNGRHHVDLVTEESSTDLNFHMKSSLNRNSDQNYSPRDPAESESGIGKARIPPVMEEKAKNRKAHKGVTPRKIDEVATRRNETLHNFARPLKHQSSILQEAKPRRSDKLSGYKGSAEQVRTSRSKEAEPHIIKSNKSASSFQQLNVIQLTKEAEQASHLYSPPGAGYLSLKEPILPSNASVSVIKILKASVLQNLLPLQFNKAHISFIECYAESKHGPNSQ